MKKIEAIIQPFKLDDVREALKSGGHDRLTIYDVADKKATRRSTVGRSTK